TTFIPRSVYAVFLSSFYPHQSSVCFCIYLHFFFMILPHLISTLFPYTTLFRSDHDQKSSHKSRIGKITSNASEHLLYDQNAEDRSEEHTSELQSRFDLVCRLLLEKKKTEVK